MPLITDRQVTQLTQLPEAPEPVEAPSVGEVFGAAFRQENSLVSLATNETSFQDYQTEEGFDPFEGKNLEGYELFAENFTDAKSSDHMSAIKQQIDNENEDRQTVAAGGALGFAAMVAAGTTDPLFWPMFLIPGGAGIKGSKSFTEAALKVGAIGGVSEIPAEAAKQYTQETRTNIDAIASIGGATILSGLLGGSLRGLSKVEADNIATKLDEVMNDAETPMVAGNTAEAHQSMGSAQAAQLTKDDLQLVSVGGLEKMGVSPLLRAENSSSVKTRQLSSEMMESASVKQANVDGKATAPTGGSAETRIKMWDAGLFQGLNELDAAYTKYRGGKGSATRVVNDFVLRNRAGKMTAKDFREEVGRVARRGDKSDIPEVQEAAESFRKNVFDPLKESAIELKLLPQDVDVKTAASYLTRVYNTQKIAAKRPEWDGVVESWLMKGKNDALLIDNPTALQKAEAAMTEREVKQIAEDITNNIMGVASGRVPYEVVPNVRGPLKERVFNIPDRFIEDFLESDIDIVSRQYVRTMAPDVELSRLYGDASMEDQLVEISSSYKELIDAAKTEKERIKLTEQMGNDQRDISAMRDRLRGTYRTPEDPNSFFIRAGRVLRDANFVRMLGGMTLSAIPDLARPVAVNGLMPVARGLRALASPKKFGMAVQEARRAGVGLDMVLNSRVASMAEITDIYNKSSSFERGLRAASDAFGKLTLMTQWNTALKSFSGVVTQDRILAAAIKVSDGTASKSTIKRLAASGIGKEQAQAIAIQFNKHGDKGDLNLSNGHLWDDREVLDTFRAAVLKDVDRTIITPGLGEKPLWTSSETGKMIFQFKTFAAAAHHKILISDLQYRDAEALNGLLLSVALGTAAYGAKEFVAGREISTDPDKLIVESLDRSGVFGYFWDANNIMEKMTRGQVGVNKLIGAPPMSRYASRNVLGALLGPSLGTAEDIATVTGAMSQGEFTESDLRRVRKLLPAQNLFYIRQLLNTLEEDIGEGL